MRSYAWPFLAALALIINACGSDQTATDAGVDGGGAGRGGSGGRGGSSARGGAGGGFAGSTGGSTAGTAGSTGGSTAGTDGGTAGSTGGSTAGTGGGIAGSTGGSTAGTGGGTAGSTGGSTAGRGGSTAGTGGGTAGSTGGSTAGRGGSTAGTGGGTAGSGGSTGGSTAGTGGGIAGSGGSTGGSTAGTTGTAGSTGGSTAGTTGTAGSTGGSTAGTGGGTGGTAGTGGGIACTDPSTCPGGADDECKQKTCIANVCGMAFTAANTVVTGQTAEDCKRNVCDGLGGVLAAIYDADPPADDGNACTSETCVNGLPTHGIEPARTPCTQNGGQMCNGSSAAPACVTCVAATDCPGTDVICHQRVCGNQGTCGFSNATAGTAAEPDATGNCQKAQCDGLGGTTSITDDTDTPADDGNPCTSDICATGTPSHPAKPDGTTCSVGGSMCVGGNCAECQTVADCPGQDTTCRTRTCGGSHTCGYNDAPQGTAAGTDATGNCKKPVCDGSGSVMSANDDTDTPADDGNACTTEVCANGTPSHPGLPAGTTCGGGKACTAAGACNDLTFRVIRVGNGTAATNGTSAAVFVEEYKTDGTLVGTVTLPTTASGSQKQLTISNSASSEGCLSLSADGRYLMLAGYATGTGIAGVVGTTSASVNRVAGRIDVSGNIDTSVAFSTAFDTNNVRGATSTDGSEIWVGGGSNGSPASGGVWYNNASAVPPQVRILASPDSTRCVSIFGNQLFGTSGDSPYVFEIGFGTPASAGQTTTQLTGVTGTNPYGIAVFGLNASALDTLYVADGTSGLRKYTLSGTTATPAGTLMAGGVRGVAGYAVGTTVTLMASTTEGTQNHLVVFVDTGSGTPTSMQVATAPMNTAFRGVAVSPHFAAP